jgi:diaminopimelate decarboxylase
MPWPDTTRRNAKGELEFGGVSAVQLAETYGTPLYVFDERTLVDGARRIRDVFRSVWPRSRVVYAGKAYLSPALMGILAQEDIGLDVVSGGEIYAGLLAGVDPSTMIFHGNNKSRRELEEAVAAGVGLIAVDNDFEIGLLEAVAFESGRTVSVVLRLNPGVDPHTHDKMRTGAVESKFGFPVWDGQARDAAARICLSDYLKLVGYHAHVGSQIFDPELVAQTIEAVADFASSVAQEYGVLPEVVIPGGGFGVADDASGDDVSIEAWAGAAARSLVAASTKYSWPLPELIVEPGRAIIAAAGVAIYEVGAQKVIEGRRTYVSVDGGMADNIRPSLYGAKYTTAPANRHPIGEEDAATTIAGKFCESGDVLIEEIFLPPLRPGDLLAIPMVGAYCLSMASNYNLAPRPAVALVSEGNSRLIRRRETYEDLLRSELVGIERTEEACARQVLLSAGKGSL